MKSFVGSVAGVIALVSLGSLCAAQVGGGGGSIGAGIGTSQTVPNHMGQNNMTQEQFNKLEDYADQAHRLTKDDKAKGKTLEQVLAEDKAAATALAKAMPLSCDVTSAMQIAQGPATVDGKQVDTKTYEAACANGLGYYLVSADPARPYGFSCFAADATHQADVAAGRQPGPICQLPPNADMKVMGANMLAKAGVTCTVKEYRWVGQNAANHTEFNEFACTDAKGYMAINALPGADIPVHVETCPQSAARGLPCKYSDNGAPLVTVQTFLDAIAQRSVACDATPGTTHVIGQDAKKRYVVEFMCLQRPKGLVAYIPLAGNTAPFEVIDCTAARKRGTMCTLTKAN